MPVKQRLGGAEAWWPLPTRPERSSLPQAHLTLCIHLCSHIQAPGICARNPGPQPEVSQVFRLGWKEQSIATILLRSEELCFWTNPSILGEGSGETKAHGGENVGKLKDCQ